ncbi:MAG TPA: helix-turn-helix transcriptional regulator [Syntrophorhabdales bacterium]|nr:helix-turn-helix transcriptional regulator [Syntrophorhabdales bacterium]
MTAFLVDISAVGDVIVRGNLLALIREAGYPCRIFDSFWHSFGAGSDGLPEGVLVLGDLSTIVGHYTRFRPHEWIASVREKRPYFVGLIRGKADERRICGADDLVRNSDMRLSLCRDLKRDLPDCLPKAASALEPHSLVDVRYSSLTRQLWVQFSDGLFGLVLWGALGLQRQVQSLMLQTATIGSNGTTIEILKESGDLFFVDGRSLRNVLAASCPPGVFTTGVGSRVRSARIKAGISQCELASKTGIHQTRISRLERGHHHPRSSTLERVAAALGYTMTEFSPKDESEPPDRTLFLGVKPAGRVPAGP